MHKRRSKRTISFIAVIFFASVAFGLFYNYQRLLAPSKNLTGPTLVESAQDSVPGKKSKAQDSISAETRKYLASGDKYFAAKDYLNAKSAYQMAVDQNPGDQVAKDKLKKTMDILRSQKAQNILFDVAIASADRLFQAGEYDKARLEYENASKLLPGDPYPKNKINEIIKIQVDKKVKDDEYARAIASADKFYTAKNLQLALIDFKKAFTIKPEEKYPQTKIKEITDLLAAQKAKDDAYNKAILIADQQFKEVQYPNAIKSYQDALTIKPEQIYPKNKIKEAEGLMNRIKKAQEDYEKFITLADSLYIEKKYFDARENYLSAKSVKPNENYPKEMISKADKMLTGQEAAMAKALEEQYSKAIAEADKLMADKSYEPARAGYLKASNLKPGDQYPKDKIQAIDDLLAALLKDKDEQYKMAIASGDKALQNKTYDLAKSEFNNALAIKPTETYPKTKIAEIDKLILLDAKRKAEDSKYTNAIASGDSLFFEKSYLPARAEFQAALKMKPTEAYPRNRIAEIDAALAEIEKQIANEAQYSALIAKADKGFSEKAYQVSRADYSKASGLKPAETYPKERMAEIDQILAGQKSLEENYQATIARADQLLSAKTYDQAKTEYQKALTIKAGEQYPIGKITEIDAILAGIAKQKGIEEEYSRILALADKLSSEKSWTEAKSQYQNALKIKVSEQYPKDKITEIDKILADLALGKALEEKFAAFILKADKLFAQKEYIPAKTEYQNASGLKPDDLYPKEKISAIDKILADVAAAKALDANYKSVIAKADQLFTAKAYTEARVEYENALKIKPGEQYPQSRIAEIEKALADIAAKKSLDENYQTTIARADQLLSAKTYDQAKTEYEKALGLKPVEQYPKSKIGEIDGILAELARQKASEEQYAEIIVQADKSLAEKSYTEAKSKYQAALKLKPAEKYPVDKIAEVDRALADLAKLKATDDQYNASIKKADDLLAQKNYPTAKAEYANASTIKPLEAYPKDKIAEIEKILADIAAAKALDENYRSVIAKADQLFTTKTYAEARVEYENALKIKPGEQYPQSRITEIEKALADIAAKKSLDENYQTTIARADQLLSAKTYDQAKTEYEKALGLKSVEQYPKSKMAEIDKILAEIAKQKALDDEYAGIIAQADKSLADKSYADAKSKYQTALKLKPAEKYPVDKIAEADRALADLAKLKAIDDQYNASVKKADDLLAQKNYPTAKAEYTNASTIKPSEVYPKDKIAEIEKILADIAAAKALEENYKSVIARADQLFSAKTYAEARVEYENALKIKPGEQYPQSRITEIEKALADIAAKKSLDENYQATIARADQLLSAKTYDQAKTEYEKALGLKPAEQYPKSKMAEIDGILAEIAKQKALDDEYAGIIALADKSLAEKSYADAKSKYQAALKLKPAEKYPVEKIAEADRALAELARLKAIDDQYSASVLKADNLLAQKNYPTAKAEYSNASTIKPSEVYPKDKISEIDKILADIAAAKALDEKYQAAITKADQLFSAKTYEQAKTEYGKALDLKPAEEYPKTKMAEIGKVLADIEALRVLNENYQAAIKQADQLFTAKTYDQAKTEYEKALGLKPQEQYPKTKLADIESILAAAAKKKALDDEYAAEVASADQLLAEKAFEAAKPKYQKAAELKPSEQYPKTKLAEIEKALADVARLKAIDDQFKSAIAEADKFFQDKKYDQAQVSYNQALKTKPGEQYPKDKITEIAGILDAIAKQKALDEQYSAKVAKGDQLMTAKSWEQAKAEYVAALALKPDEQYPKGKITEIDGILADLKAKDDAYKSAVASADQLLFQKKYEEARTEYQNSLAIKPQATYPKEKIAEISKTLEELLGKQKYYDNLIKDADLLYSDKDYPKARDTYQRATGVFPDQAYPKERVALLTARLDSLYKANKSRYDKAVADGDRFFNSFEFDKAIDAYTEAANFLPMESYPNDMILKIRRTIAENAIADVLKSSVTITSNNEKQFSFTPVNIASRKNNFVYIKIKNLSGKPFNVLMRYGKDKQSNGGIVMRNITIDGKVNERLVSVKDQDLWSREDNNWISIIPQGGDVEVTFIQVSRARLD